MLREIAKNKKIQKNTKPKYCHYFISINSRAHPYSRGSNAYREENGGILLPAIKAISPLQIPMHYSGKIRMWSARVDQINHGGFISISWI